MDQGYCLHGKVSVNYCSVKWTRDIACMARDLLSVVLSKCSRGIACIRRYLLIVVLSYGPGILLAWQGIC